MTAKGWAVLVPMEPTAKMYSEGLAVVNRTLNPPDSVYAAMLSASPFIDGVPVDVVERMARAIANSEGWDNWDTAQHCGDTMHGNDPDDERNGYRDMARAALTAAGLKVADNG
jgi:hypothetical protein